MVTISTRIEEEEKKELQLLADKNDVSIAWIVRRAIKEYLEKTANEDELFKAKYDSLKIKD